MSDGLKIVLLLATVLVAFVVVVVPAAERQAAEGPRPMPMTAPARTVTPAPNADNVDHAVRAEMRRLERALDAAPDDTTLLFRMARLLHDAHRPAEAASYYERYLQLHPINRQAWLDLADCCASAAQWEQARTAMEALLVHFPDDPAGFYNLGAIHANLGDFAGARSWWTRARDQDADTDLARRAVASLERIAAR